MFYRQWRGYTALVLIPALGLLSWQVGAQILRSEAKPVPPRLAYMQPVPGLSYQQLRLFREGEKELSVPWVVFPGLGGHWGLGPTFIADACSVCHVQAGRGRTVDNTIIVQQLLRVSVPGAGPHGAPNPHPNYQLQVFGVSVGLKENRKPGEADVYVDWLPHRVKLGDGTVVELRKPVVRIDNLSFGPLGDDTMTSLRNTQALFGLGYLEAVTEATLKDIAARQQTQGLNGRLNYVRDDVRNKTSVGRFGWKANQPSIRQQIAAAFLGDMGVTSSLYIEENCQPVQTLCLAMPPGNRPELLNYNWDQLEFWQAALAPPPPRKLDDPQVQRGEQLFEQAKCAQCHVPELQTGDYKLLPLIAMQKFRAFTDLLLHDMGDDLADGRPDYLAGPRDWRTPPLWGIGMSAQVNGSTNLLHDGRARNVLEAILWHGGEAKGSRDSFADMPQADRDALIAFVNAI